MGSIPSIVVFDGTSAYVIDAGDLAQEIEDNNVEVLREFDDIDDAFVYCNAENESIIG